MAAPYAAPRRTPAPSSRLPFGKPPRVIHNQARPTASGGNVGSEAYQLAISRRCPNHHDLSLPMCCSGSCGRAILFIGTVLPLRLLAEGTP